MNKDERKDCGYMLCASPRSGSTLLCDLLRQSGVAGSPESFFRPESIDVYARDWGIQSTKQSWDESYIQAVRQYSISRGRCVGVRIMWSNVPEFSTRLEQLYPKHKNTKHRLLDSLSIDRYIHLTRDDKVSQAVSLIIAQQTGLWHINADGSERQRTDSYKQPIYNHQRILDALQKLQNESTGWEAWFEANEIKPLRVTYEDMVSEPLKYFNAAMNFLGQTTQSDIQVGTGRMATKLNREWSDRFRNETEH